MIGIVVVESIKLKKYIIKIWVNHVYVTHYLEMHNTKNQKKVTCNKLGKRREANNVMIISNLNYNVWEFNKTNLL